MFQMAIENALQGQLLENIAGLQEHEKIKESLRSIEGKNWQSRHAKLLPEGFTEHNQYQMTHIIGPKPAARSHLLLWHTDMVYTAKKFEHADSCYFTGTKERITQINKLLKEVPEMAAMFYTLKTSFDAVKGIATQIEEGNRYDSYNNPVYYEVLKLCGISSEIMQAIKYRKL